MVSSRTIGSRNCRHNRPHGPRVESGVGPMGVYEQLRESIVEGRLHPGESLVEATLAATYGVSRTPVREALTRLQHDGLIHRGDRGLVVRESSPEEILDIYDTRVILEAQAARLAAKRRSEFDLARIRNEQERMHECLTKKSPPGECAQQNRTFHRAVWRASGSGSLIDLLERLNTLLGRYPATTLASPGRLEAANAEHNQIIEAIADGDAELAAEVATRHFLAARDIRLQLSLH
jgi:DNA-binding GntR family transcriptional regulator